MSSGLGPDPICLVSSQEEAETSGLCVLRKEATRGPGRKVTICKLGGGDPGTAEPTLPSTVDLPAPEPRRACGLCRSACGILLQHPEQARAPLDGSDGPRVTTTWSALPRCGAASSMPVAVLGHLRTGTRRTESLTCYGTSAKLCTTLEASVNRRRCLTCQGRHTEEERTERGWPLGSRGGIQRCALATRFEMSHPWQRFPGL